MAIPACNRHLLRQIWHTLTELSAYIKACYEDCDGFLAVIDLKTAQHLQVLLTKLSNKQPISCQKWGIAV